MPADFGAGEADDLKVVDMRSGAVRTAGDVCGGTTRNTLVLMLPHPVFELVLDGRWHHVVLLARCYLQPYHGLRFPKSYSPAKHTLHLFPQYPDQAWLKYVLAGKQTQDLSEFRRPRCGKEFRRIAGTLQHWSSRILARDEDEESDEVAMRRAELISIIGALKVWGRAWNNRSTQIPHMRMRRTGGLEYTSEFLVHCFRLCWLLRNRGKVAQAP